MKTLLAIAIVLVGASTASAQIGTNRQLNEQRASYQSSRPLPPDVSFTFNGSGPLARYVNGTYVFSSDYRTRFESPFLRLYWRWIETRKPSPVSPTAGSGFTLPAPMFGAGGGR